MGKNVRMLFFCVSLLLLSTACSTTLSGSRGSDLSRKDLFGEEASTTVAETPIASPLSTARYLCFDAQELSNDSYISWSLCEEETYDEEYTQLEPEAPSWGVGLLVETAFLPPSCDDTTDSLNPYLPHYADLTEYTETDTLPRVPVVINANVEYFINYFQTSARDHFAKWLIRSQGYMSSIKTILREEGVPEDLYYIALIESGLNPNARSRKGAVGMWQFIQSTARRYGLRVDWWIDERRDPEKSTRAAARYLKNLYDQFDSWYLAAAGYNTGEGRVKRAVRKHGSTDFWELAKYRRPFGRETRNYVPKYLAAMLIAKNPRQYGFEDIEYTDGISYDKVQVAIPTDLRVIARAAGTTVGEIRRLNPELKRWFTPPDYPDYEIKLPAGTAEEYAKNIELIPPQQRLVFQRHRVRRGDTLHMIARKYGTPVRQIIYLNGIKNPRLIYPGTMIVVPVRARGSDKVAAKEFFPPQQKSGFRRHKVRRGETLYKIARKYDVRIEQLIHLNGLKNPRLIYPGTTILIPVKA